MHVRVESSDDPIISKDLDGIITSWNAAATRILGYTPDEIIGKSILTLIPEELHSDEPLIISRIRAGQRIEHFDTIRRAKSGELLEVSLTISPVKDDTGTIIGASKILRDISGRKRIENSLIQAEKIAATGRMAATIASKSGAPNERAERLVEGIKAVLRDAIKAGGSSLRDHKRTDGELGMFQHHFRVYDREGEKCPTPGCHGKIKRIVQSGRPTFYCPSCQK